MFKFFKSKEVKRIEELFIFYKKQIDTDINENEALLNTWGELKKRSGQLKNKAGYSERTLDSKKVLLRQLFESFGKVENYDIFKTIGFIITWEFPEKYNYAPTIENMLSQNNPRSLLDENVKEIGGTILK